MTPRRFFMLLLRATVEAIITIVVVIVIFFIMAALESCATVRSAVVPAHSVYLPIVQNVPFVIKFGVENEDFPGGDAAQFYRGDFAKISIHWAIVEPLPGYYDWHYSDDKLFGSPLFLSLKGAPAWANANRLVCRPPMPEYYAAQLAWMRAAIERYQPIAVEYWNEPEATPFAPLYLGCYGNTYAAGVQYGQDFNRIYAALKPDYPDLQFIAGGLLDVRNIFAAGMLNTITTADAVSFHLYQWCGQDYILDDFVAHLRTMTDLPLVLSETSLIYINDSLQCQQEQVEWLRYVRNHDGVAWSVWYNLIRTSAHDWRHSTMVVDGVEKPVYGEYLKGTE
jgi:hypothetical protein